MLGFSSLNCGMGMVPFQPNRLDHYALSECKRSNWSLISLRSYLLGPLGLKHASEHVWLDGELPACIHYEENGPKSNGVQSLWHRCQNTSWWRHGYCEDIHSIARWKVTLKDLVIAINTLVSSATCFCVKSFLVGIPLANLAVDGATGVGISIWASWQSFWMALTLLPLIGIAKIDWSFGMRN